MMTSYILVVVARRKIDHYYSLHVHVLVRIHSKLVNFTTAENTQMNVGVFHMSKKKKRKKVKRAMLARDKHSRAP